MIYLTGATHRDFVRVREFCHRERTDEGDILVILGDAGINYFGDERDEELKRDLDALPITLFCVHGNHEQRPRTLPSYHRVQWHGGHAYQEPAHPSLLFAEDGEVYELGGTLCVAIGGAYSADKPYRLLSGWQWWPDEQPSPEDKSRVERQLEDLDWSVDAVLTHTCPARYIPKKEALIGPDHDLGTEQWLDMIESRLEYGAWYCGHFHTSQKADKLYFLYQDFTTL